MARCYCRWHRVLIYVCTPCIFLALVFIYVSIMLTMAMTNMSTPSIKALLLETTHVVATGAVHDKDHAPYPKTFWQSHLHGEAMWNHIQKTVDRHFNPILHPNNVTKGPEKSKSYESVLKQSFNKVMSLESTRTDFEQLPQQMQDFVSHMQRRDYPTLIQPDGACGAGVNDEMEPPLVLLAIKSTELNFKNRHAIRKTWGQVGWVAEKRSNSAAENGGYVRRVFLLGRGNTDVLDVDISDLLQMESERHNDILQWDFSDTFFNLTLKDVLFWKWFSQSCKRTRFVFKGDDDVFVNTPKMMTYLRDQLKKPQAQESMKDFMAGEVISAGVPNRVNVSKYFIPHSFYKGLYPMYAGGGGVVYSGVLATRLNHISKRVNLFPIDDVFVGMCMVQLNALLVHHPAFLTFDFPDKEEEELCSYHRILVVHKRSPEQLMKLWADMEKTQPQCWDVPLREAKKKDKPS